MFFMNESDRIPGFTKKIEAHIKKHGSIKKTDAKWIVSVNKNLNGKTIRPITARNENRNDAVNAVVKELLRLLDAGTGEPVMVPVQSSNIAKIGYTAESKTLYVEFKGNTKYMYKNVPEHVAIELMDASSHGKYLAAFVKDVYPVTKIE